MPGMEGNMEKGLLELGGGKCSEGAKVQKRWIEDWNRMEWSGVEWNRIE